MIVLVCFNYLLKQTFRKGSFVALSALICALFVGMSWPYAIEQSKTQISAWLADSALMLDLSVILTVEVIVQMAFCLVAARVQTSGKVQRRVVWAYRVLRWFPGVLVYPVVFYMLVALVFALPGTSYSRIAWTLAALVVAVIVAGRYGLNRLLPEKEIRLELLFLMNALVAILGIVATVNGKTAVAGVSEVNWPALGGVLLLLGGGLVCGAIFFQVRLRKRNNKTIIR